MLASAATDIPRRTPARWARQERVRPGESSAHRDRKARERERWEERIRERPYGSHASPERAELWIRSFEPLPGEKPWRERSRHTVNEHTEGLRLYCAAGPREASRRSGIPLRTVTRWARAHGLHHDADRTHAATRARVKAAALRRGAPIIAAFAGVFGLAEPGTIRIPVEPRRSPMPAHRAVATLAQGLSDESRGTRPRCHLRRNRGWACHLGEPHVAGGVREAMSMTWPEQSDIEELSSSTAAGAKPRIQAAINRCCNRRC